MIKVSIWYPQNTPLDTDPVTWYFATAMRWGHAGIKFRDVPGRENRYFAFWPQRGATDLRVPVPGEIRHHRGDDVTEEGTLPTRIIRLAHGLNEVAAYDYWSALAGRRPIYQWNGLNCCQAVADSIAAGLGSGGGAHLPLTPTSLVVVALASATPYSLERWLIHQVMPSLAAPSTTPEIRAPHPGWSRG